MGNKNIPDIRFKGFHENWKFNKIGKITNSFSGGTPLAGFKEFYENGTIPFIRSGEISKDYTELKITELGLRNSSAKLVDKGTILYALYGATSGEVSISKQFGAINQAILAIYPHHTENNLFISYWLRKQKESIVKTFLQGGQGNLSGNIIKNLDINIPAENNLNEQTQIGNFFKTIDEQINLQEQKHQKLINLKKAMLEKMFPKEGADVPEIRFKGFTEKWEVKKLIEYLEVSKDKNKNLEYSKNDVLSVSGEFGIVNQIALQGRSFAGASVANYGIVKVGEIVYTKSPLKKNPFGIIKTNRFQTGIVSTLYAIYSAKNNVDSTFVEYYFAKDDRLNKYLNPLISKGAKNDMKVSDENALKGKVIFPKSKEEQKCIAKYFTQLDSLINVSTEQLDKFKNIKQALLQKMFV